MPPYYQREGVEMTWREVARYEMRDVVLWPHVHVGDEVYQAREHHDMLFDCDYCGDCEDVGEPVDALLFVALHWLTEACEPCRLPELPDMDQHGEFTTPWLPRHRVRQVGDPWDSWFVVEEFVRGLHPVEEYTRGSCVRVREGSSPRRSSLLPLAEARRRMSE